MGQHESHFLSCSDVMKLMQKVQAPQKEPDTPEQQLMGKAERSSWPLAFNWPSENGRQARGHAQYSSPRACWECGRKVMGELARQSTGLSGQQSVVEAEMCRSALSESPALGPVDVNPQSSQGTLGVLPQEIWF